MIFFRFVLKYLNMLFDFFKIVDYWSSGIKISFRCCTQFITRSIRLSQQDSTVQPVMCRVVGGSTLSDQTIITVAYDSRWLQHARTFDSSRTFAWTNSGLARNYSSRPQQESSRRLLFSADESKSFQ